MASVQAPIQNLVASPCDGASKERAPLSKSLMLEHRHLAYHGSDDLTPPTVRHVAIEASDPKRSGEFYRGAFDLKELERSDEEVTLSDGSISVSFVKKGGGGSCQLTLMGLEVEDPEKLAAAFPSHAAAGNGRFAVTDPDGNRLELRSQWAL